MFPHWLHLQQQQLLPLSGQSQWHLWQSTVGSSVLFQCWCWPWNIGVVPVNSLSACPFSRACWAGSRCQCWCLFSLSLLRSFHSCPLCPLLCAAPSPAAQGELVALGWVFQHGVRSFGRWFLGFFFCFSHLGFQGWWFVWVWGSVFFPSLTFEGFKFGFVLGVRMMWSFKVLGFLGGFFGVVY